MPPVGGTPPYPAPLEGPKMAPMTLKEGSHSHPSEATAVHRWKETQRVMALDRCCVIVTSTKVPYDICWRNADCLIFFPKPNEPILTLKDQGVFS